MFTMKIFLQFVLFVSALVFSPTNGQLNTAGCGAALQDVPNPSSDSCTAFFRCYQRRQYSLRCPLGQAFHFDRARCRPEQEVDCPLQLQRFQAPAVPHHLRPPNAPQEREVEIRVVHVAPGVDPNNLRFYNNGRQVPVSRQTGVQRGGHTLISAQQQPAAQPLDFQQTPVLFRSPGDQTVLGLPDQGQVAQGQPVQGQVIQPVQGQVTIQNLGQVPQGQIIQPQPVQGQTIQGSFLQVPAQTQG